MSNTPLHSVSVAGVTFDERGRVLLIKRRDNSQWQAPGGVLELGETFEDGVEREVFEETGVRVKVEHLTGVYKNILKGVVALVYKCSPVSGQAGPSDEASEVAWLYMDAIRDLVQPAFAVRILDALATTQRGPASRAHDGFNLL